ncbi:cytochrome c oxidase subunit II [Archaeoglobus neptunius]|uniref:cytochrome c oxidase subunit II n=1 Tax=Archaeoglobus neptunius TaxID=2798580 RepID=UPI0019289756|nr:cytochrome c oxidase subunit II [Archaeoglobus neptunius]
MEKREFAALLFVVIALAIPVYLTIDRLSEKQTGSEIVINAYVPESGGFKPNYIVVPKGSRVKLVFKSEDVTHGIFIPDLGINKLIPAGDEVVVEFVAEKSGVYPFMCSVYCSPYHRLMRGTIVVV